MQGGCGASSPDSKDRQVLAARGEAWPPPWPRAAAFGPGRLPPDRTGCATFGAGPCPEKAGERLCRQKGSHGDTSCIFPEDRGVGKADLVKALPVGEGGEGLAQEPHQLTRSGKIRKAPLPPGHRNRRPHWGHPGARTPQGALEGQGFECGVSVRYLPGTTRVCKKFSCGEGLAAGGAGDLVLFPGEKRGRGAGPPRPQTHIHLNPLRGRTRRGQVVPEKQAQEDTGLWSPGVQLEDPGCL